MQALSQLCHLIFPQPREVARKAHFTDRETGWGRGSETLQVTQRHLAGTQVSFPHHTESPGNGSTVTTPRAYSDLRIIRIPDPTLDSGAGVGPGECVLTSWEPVPYQEAAGQEEGERGWEPTEPRKAEEKGHPGEDMEADLAYF